MRESLLFLGMALGLSLSFYSTKITNSKGLIASVNDRPVSLEKYKATLSQIRKGKRNPLTEKEKEIIINRLIEEELLFQNAKTLGLLEKDPLIRKTIVSSMIDFIKRPSKRDRPPSEEDLKKFFFRNKPEFIPAKRIRVSTFSFSQKKNVEKLKSLIQKGASFQTLKKKWGESSFEVPEMLLPGNTIRSYLGPTLTQKAFKMNTGEILGPLERGKSFVVVKVLEREAKEVSFEKVRSRVLDHFLRREKENNLRKKLEEMKDKARIKIFRAKS
ncbi:MAG: peptidylprolyl isomerase [Bdellovibrionota bacterium]|nr:peptidylprolyl isomerase [Bdellovibrionota bacterium]